MFAAKLSNRVLLNISEVISRNVSVDAKILLKGHQAEAHWMSRDYIGKASLLHNLTHYFLKKAF